MWFFIIYLPSKQGYTCSETGKSKIMIYIYWRKAQNSGPIATLFKFYFFLLPFSAWIIPHKGHDFIGDWIVIHFKNVNMCLRIRFLVILNLTLRLLKFNNEKSMDICYIFSYIVWQKNANHLSKYTKH